jgi:hypothetical protein
MIAKMITASVQGWAVALTWVVVLAAGSAFAQGKQSNTIVSVKSINSGQAYEVLVNAAEPFLRSDLPVLRIGDQEVTISRAPDDGSSDSRIFILTSEQFGKAKSGDKVAFQWGRGEGKRQLDLGTLDKAKLQEGR